MLEYTSREELYVFPDCIKEGYLTKRNRNFGGWKRRYYVLHHNMFEYFSSQEQAALVYRSRMNGATTQQASAIGQYDMKMAEVGKQLAPPPEYQVQNSEPLHGLSIKLRSTFGSSNRMILCAESDFERDNWVFHIANNINYLMTGQVPPMFTEFPATRPTLMPVPDPRLSIM